MLELYKARLQATTGTEHPTMGEVLRQQANMIMDATWENDTQHQKAFIYSFDTSIGGYSEKQPIDIKFIKGTKYTVLKDQVEYYLQFRPGVHANLGSYIDIPDDVGNLHTWLLVGRNNDEKFVKYNILECNYNFKWVADGKLYSCLGVERSRNSYNAGVWTDYLVTTVENQTAVWLPTNEYTVTIDYDTRMVISSSLRKKKPLCWKVSKIEETLPAGVSKFTFKQHLFNPHVDIPDETGEFVADLGRQLVDDSNEPSAATYSIISSSEEHMAYIGDTVVFQGYFFDADNNELELEGSWDVDTPSICSDIESSGNILKLKIKKDYSIGGLKFTVKFAEKNTGDYSSTYKVEVKVI